MILIAEDVVLNAFLFLVIDLWSRSPLWLDVSTLTFSTGSRFSYIFKADFPSTPTQSLFLQSLRTRTALLKS